MNNFFFKFLSIVFYFFCCIDFLILAEERSSKKIDSNNKKVKVISPRNDLQQVFDDAPSDTVFLLEDGVYEGSFVVNKKATIIGNNAIIKSKGSGTTIKIHPTASETKLIGLTVDGSGSRYDLQDAAIYISADRCLIQSNFITNAIFGIVVEKANYVQVKDNIVYGNNEKYLGLRGDAVRFWEMRHSLIQGNKVYNSRDVIVWYSHHNQIIENTIQNGRYGTHLMYCHSNILLRNDYRHNVVGTFIMYSRNVELSENIFAGATGAAGYGIGVKESGNLNFFSNYIIKNTTGVYLDVSPFDLREKNIFFQNHIEFCHTSIYFHGSPKWNFISNNNFCNNYNQVQVDGGGNATSILWNQNYFDDFTGYDLDKDNISEMPYRLQKLSDDLISKHASLKFFTGTISFYLVDLIGKLIPLLKPRLILEDKNPRIKKN